MTVRMLVLVVSVALSAVGWWAGIGVGVVWSLVVTGGLVTARRVRGPLGAMPLWQILLVPVLGMLAGIGLGGLMFIVGPGF